MSLKPNNAEGFLNAGLFLQPNPARELVVVDGLLFDKVVYEIHNLSGNLLQEGVVNDKIIDISLLMPGIYIVRLKVSDQWQSLRLLKLNY